MSNVGTPSEYGLENHGRTNLRTIYWNLNPSALVEQALFRQEGILAEGGAIIVDTGQFTGRSPYDKYLVPISKVQADDEIWWGKNFQPISSERFESVYQKITSYLQGRDVFVKDMMVGAHPDHSLSLRVVSEKAWQSLFCHNLFLRLADHQVVKHIPQYTVIACPGFLAKPDEDGTRSQTFIFLDFSRKLILIGGTSYAGEIKKSIFTAMNFEMPHAHVLPMHCAANVGEKGDVALFFGLSGTGKTTLSSDSNRRLIGDDEHGWSEAGIFNFEGGCYAKTIRLQPDLEPLIWKATQQFGSVLENVVCDETTRKINFDNDRRTENTRGAFPLDFLENRIIAGFAGHPTNIFFLTADAFGVLPPIASLNADQAIYYFLSGYTSKLAGTEKGLSSEPQATFSTCFGAPFLPLHPSVYANLLREKISRHKARVWLINTGWTGGPYGIGSRIKLPYTRAMIHAVLNGRIDDQPVRQDDYFGLFVPDTCPDVPSELLHPHLTWKDKADYENQARKLILRFEENFEQFKNIVQSSICSAGLHHT